MPTLYADTTETETEFVANLAKRLDDLDNVISRRIVEINEGLRRILGIRVQVNWNNDRALAFGKLDGAWGLILVYTGTGVETPLLSAPRDVRAAVFIDKVIHHLVAGAASQLTQAVAQREQAIGQAEDVVRAMTQNLRERKP